VEARAGWCLLECEPEEVGRVEPMDGVPAILAVAQVRRDALFTRKADERGKEVPVSMNGWR
jgi:hypothetical protein